MESTLSCYHPSCTFAASTWADSQKLSCTHKNKTMRRNVYSQAREMKKPFDVLLRLCIYCIFIFWELSCMFVLCTDFAHRHSTKLMLHSNSTNRMSSVKFRRMLCLMFTMFLVVCFYLIILKLCILWGKHLWRSTVHVALQRHAEMHNLI